MKVKLTPVKSKYKNKYVIEVEFMHGDADAYTTESFVCKNEADFIRIISNDVSSLNRHKEDEYDEQMTKLFGEDFCPCDCTCEDYRASIQEMNGFYYDVAGTKFNATLTK